MLIIDRFERDYAIIENEDEYYDVKKIDFQKIAMKAIY